MTGCTTDLYGSLYLLIFKFTMKGMKDHEDWVLGVFRGFFLPRKARKFTKEVVYYNRVHRYFVGIILGQNFTKRSQRTRRAVDRFKILGKIEDY
jgi:hypothetical protein